MSKRYIEVRIPWPRENVEESLRGLSGRVAKLFKRKPKTCPYCDGELLRTTQGRRWCPRDSYWG